MSNRLTRRAFMGGLAAGSLLPWWPALGANDAAASQAAFPWGVASGDPDAHSVVLWTRVASPRLEARVTWTLADDPAFLSVRARGELRTDVAKYYGVHPWTLTWSIRRLKGREHER